MVVKPSATRLSVTSSVPPLTTTEMFRPSAATIQWLLRCEMTVVGTTRPVGNEFASDRVGSHLAQCLSDVVRGGRSMTTR